MKETINVNIGAQAFTLDKDAYNRLSLYLDDVAGRITEAREEVMTDIEARLAEMFHEWLSSPMMVVTLSMVERAIKQMGEPDTFGPKHTQTGGGSSPKGIRRSRTDRSIAGVCGGLAKYFGIDTTVLRIAMLCLILFGGMSLWVYIILWLLIPEE